MKKYHILWKNLETDFFSTGIDYDAIDEITALQEWRTGHETAVFFAIYLKSN